MQINSGPDTNWQTAIQSSRHQGRPLALVPAGDQKTSGSSGFHLFGKDGPGFADLLDVINPLQHLPVIGSIYREMTGDELAPAARLAGGALFFGPVGLAGSALDVVLEESTGNDLGGNIMAFLGAEKVSPKDSAETKIADAPELTEYPMTDRPAAAGTDAADPVTAWAVAELNHRQVLAEERGLDIPPQPYSDMMSVATHPAPSPVPELATSWGRPADLKDSASTPGRVDKISRANAAYRTASLAVPALHPESTISSNGEIGTDGGWFTSVMLDALAKSRSGQVDKTDQPQPRPQIHR